ncbi:hypothetical protein T484DRAFT_1845558 [Baffinella frigidus]|nr:hypothetical protein T484DRAFT_1845558 [Cryptophyta sp. CCMP2293]
MSKEERKTTEEEYARQKSADRVIEAAEKMMARRLQKKLQEQGEEAPGQEELLRQKALLMEQSRAQRKARAAEEQRQAILREREAGRMRESQRAAKFRARVAEEEAKLRESSSTKVLRAGDVVQAQYYEDGYYYEAEERWAALSQYCGDGYYYEAEVLCQNDDGTYSIMFTEYGDEQDTDAQDLQPLRGSVLYPPSLPRLAV